ncbi:hypothetical protein [Mycobacterium neglectum]|uniref:hypothetical protein n=1 Tax=Mycobacterium neglectum TaxID=242737 RepID=UPI000BFEF0D3|nr:hypothetical protein [Mycobacterium neglectum]
MTLTNDQWSNNLTAEDDDGFGYPQAPAFDLPPGAESTYTALDEDEDGYDDIGGDPDDDAGDDAPAEQGFGDCRDPEDGEAGPGDDDVSDYDDYPVDGQALTGPVDDGQDGAAEPRRARRFDGKVAMGFAGAGLVAVLVAIVGAVAVYGSDESKPTGTPNGADAVALPPPRPAAPAPAASPTLDRPISYTADAMGSCAEGSTSAQTMAGTDPHAAFVCVRGGGDGQFIDIELPGTHLITAISGEFGWVGTDASGTKPWSQYRVVTTVQYTFNDTDGTLVTQETKNVHGEAVQPIKRVLASKIRMLVRETSRPPAQPEGGASATNKPSGPLGLELPQLPGVLGGGQQNSDPVDAAFAIKSLKIIGHKPV